MTLTPLRTSILLLCLYSASSMAQNKGDTSAPRPAPKEQNATPLKGDLPADLKVLKESGLVIQGDRVIFEDQRSFPPKLKGQWAESGIKPEITPGRRLNIQETRKTMRASAVENPKVIAVIGKRFSLLTSGWLDNEKDKEDSSSDRYQLVFYNYANNHVVTVITSDKGEIQDIHSRPVTVQPAESREEVEAAANILRANARYASATKDLLVRGIQTEGRGQNRYLHLWFYRENRTPAAFEAVVDISAGKVVSARSLR